jgi:methionyl-tRNA formyltransferase
MAALRITVLSDETTWMNEYISAFVNELHSQGHYATWIHEPSLIEEGDILLLLSCGQIVKSDRLQLNRHNLVVHESALPQGKGWSPLTWQILEGCDVIPVTLFEATEKVDAGAIYLQDIMRFEGHELVEELRAVQAHRTFELCRRFLAKYPRIATQGRAQLGDATYYERRSPQDSELDPDQTLREQFNLLRVVDNDRYPAWFELNGVRYILKIEKALPVLP